MLKISAAIQGLCLTLLLFSCTDNSIRVGLLGGYSGRMSLVGTGGRNAILLHLEEINQQGGWLGRQVVPILYNDESNPELAPQIIEQIMKDRPLFLFGPYTSNMIAIIEGLQSEDMLIISPSVSTELLSGKHDNFIRLIPDTSSHGQGLATLLAQDGIRRPGIVMDISNKEYTKHVESALISSFQGQFVFTLQYESNQSETHLQNLVDEIKKYESDGIVFICNGRDAADFSQYIQKTGLSLMLYGSRWTKTQDFISFGGDAVEGAKLMSEFKPSEGSPAFEEFRLNYEDTYRESPNFSSIYAYEAILLLSDAISQSNSMDLDLIKAHILNKIHKGLFEEIYINEFGDAFRKEAYVEIKDSMFINKTLE
jgi:branched-chain amino acid transport system substrate-binding protein